MDYKVSFGRVGKSKPAAPGTAFRLAILGDFSGRANAGVVQTGAALAGRKAHKVDADNLDTLIERIKPDLSVAIGAEGETIAVPIGAMDDFHPDQLAANLPVFEDLLLLRRNLASKAGFDRAAKQVLSWAGAEPLPPAPRQARGTAIATDRKLSDFTRLTGRKPAAEAASEDLIRRLIGPSLVAARDSRQDALTARVDAALSDAMRRVLHNPDFQTAEALWRGLEFIVRGIETDARMQIVLYDISAEELAADLAASDSLDQSALYSLLVEQPAQDAYQGPLSLIASLYQFEAIPPHAELLGRVAQIAAAAGAPFVSGIGADPLATPMHDWHKLTRSAWDSLRALPAAAYLSLVTPRFLLRMPYGKKTDPIDAFPFEEFTRQSGLSGMLWGHPALLFAHRIAATWRRDGAKMKPGAMATIGDLPVYVLQDADGEQIALPCTERLFTERQAGQIATTGVNPVIALRGRPEVRVGGFTAISGGLLAGRWAPADMPAPGAAPPKGPADPELETQEPEATAAAEPGDAEPGDAAEAEPAEATADVEPGEAPAGHGLDDLDTLLASLNTGAPAAAEDATEPDLDALLASLT